MLKCEILDVQGFGPAIKGMRNPMNSWDKMDSALCMRDCDDCLVEEPTEGCMKNGTWDEDLFCVGKNDMDLMQRLFKAGTEHRKYLRMIQVWMDITAPLYWWKELDTYKVGTVANSCSTMHKIHEKKFFLDDFSYENILDDYTDDTEGVCIDGCCGYYANDGMMLMVDLLNHYRTLYLDTSDKKYWYCMIQLLPSSYNQTRTVMLNYETVARIIEQRRGHKLDEWKQLIDALETLPYINEIMGRE